MWFKWRKIDPAELLQLVAK